MEVTPLDIAIISLLLIISAVGITIRSLRVPYPIALVIAGLALGVLLRSSLSTMAPPSYSHISYLASRWPTRSTPLAGC